MKTIYNAFFKITLVLTILSFIFLIINNNKLDKKYKKKELYELAVLKKDKSWIYEITYKNKVIIKQNYIPVVQGNQTFTSKEDAEKIGKLVVYKLNNNKNPMVNYQDLVENNINYKK